MIEKHEGIENQELLSINVNEQEDSYEKVSEDAVLVSEEKEVIEEGSIPMNMQIAVVDSLDNQSGLNSNSRFLRSLNQVEKGAIGYERNFPLDSVKEQVDDMESGAMNSNDFSMIAAVLTKISRFISDPSGITDAQKKAILEFLGALSEMGYLNETDLEDSETGSFEEALKSELNALAKDFKGKQGMKPNEKGKKLANLAKKVNNKNRGIEKIISQLPLKTEDPFTVAVKAINMKLGVFDKLKNQIFVTSGITFRNGLVEWWRRNSATVPYHKGMFKVWSSVANGTYSLTPPTMITTSLFILKLQTNLAAGAVAQSICFSIKASVINALGDIVVFQSGDLTLEFPSTQSNATSASLEAEISPWSFGIDNAYIDNALFRLDTDKPLELVITSVPVNSTLSLQIPSYFHENQTSRNE